MYGLCTRFVCVRCSSGDGEVDRSKSFRHPHAFLTYLDFTSSERDKERM